MTHIAVIDLGTNTFHLLIASTTEADYNIIRRERVFVRLAEGGIQSIGPEAFDRGLSALKRFKALLDDYQVENVRAFGTAALRTASNAHRFVQSVKDQLALDIEIIDGLEEARLIHLGVKQAVEMPNFPSLIMDIGGGSVEFIICDRAQVFWTMSFPIGVAVLLKRFHQSDPIAPEEISALNHHLETILQPMRKQISRYQPKTLIGASGTFDVISMMVGVTDEQVQRKGIDISMFKPVYNMMVASTIAERKRMEGLPEDRIDMIVVALELIQAVLRLAPIEALLISPFALKEGALTEMNQPIL